MHLDINDPLVAASRWYSILASGSATAEDIAAWQTWKSNEDNHKAWLRVEALTKRLESVPAHINADTFLSVSSVSRRQALKNLVGLCGVGATSVWLYKAQPWRDVFADYVTAVGEIRETQLADGSLIFINTNSAVNIRFDQERRLIELVRGEIIIHTAHEAGGQYRPLIVSTQHGRVTALGTKFSVRDQDQNTKVAVSEGAVEVKPAYAQHLSITTIQAGQSITFDTRTYSSLNEEVSMAWAKGILVVYSMPLNLFLKELSRYRKGILRCDPAVANILVSGSFLIADTHAVLNHLTQILPVRVESITDYWLTIRPV